MHVLVATDGQLDPDTASSFVTRLAGSDGAATVMTVVEVPRAFLHEMRQEWGAAPTPGVIADDEYVETPAVPPEAPFGWPGDDALIGRYLHDKREERTGPLVDALKAAGIESECVVVEAENVSGTVIAEAKEREADVIVIGSHGQGVFSGLLGSTGTKLVRRSPIPVLLIRQG
ncbi:MAG: universal stress protein [Actinomycetota bacterium]